MTLRKLTLIGLTVALLAPLTLMAQGPGNLAKILPPPGYLMLTDEQKDSTRALAEDLRDSLAPVREQQRDLGQQLRDALAADSPDATIVGQLTLDLRALSQQSRAEIAAFGDAFRAILDADQQSKWDHFTELRRLQRRQG